MIYTYSLGHHYSVMRLLIVGRRMHGIKTMKLFKAKVYPLCHMV